MSASFSFFTLHPHEASSAQSVFTSVNSGTRSMRASSPVSSAPHMMGSTAFLDVLMGISPRSGGLSRTA